MMQMKSTFWLDQVYINTKISIQLTHWKVMEKCSNFIKKYLADMFSHLWAARTNVDVAQWNNFNFS